jgi:hypothetical protein
VEGRGGDDDRCEKSAFMNSHTTIERVGWKRRYRRGYYGYGYPYYGYGYQPYGYYGYGYRPYGYYGYSWRY